MMRPKTIVFAWSPIHSGNIFFTLRTECLLVRCLFFSQKESACGKSSMVPQFLHGLQTTRLSRMWCLLWFKIWLPSLIYSYNEHYHSLSRHAPSLWDSSLFYYTQIYIMSHAIWSLHSSTYSRRSILFRVWSFFRAPLWSKMFDSISSFKGPGFQYCRALFWFKISNKCLLDRAGIPVPLQDDPNARIFVTQPRRFAAKSLAKRVGQQLDDAFADTNLNIFPPTFNNANVFSPGKIIFLDCLFLETKPKLFFQMLLCFSVFLFMTRSGSFWSSSLFRKWAFPWEKIGITSFRLYSPSEVQSHSFHYFFCCHLIGVCKGLTGWWATVWDVANARSRRRHGPRLFFSLSSKVSSELVEVVSWMFLLIATICHRHCLNSNLFRFLWGMRFPFSLFRSHTVQKPESQPLQRSPAHESIKIWTRTSSFPPPFVTKTCHKPGSSVMSFFF